MAPDDSRQRVCADSELPDGKEFTMAESRNKRVLIVDNNEEESGRLGVMLQRAGYDSIATWSGLEALELLKSGDVRHPAGKQLPSGCLCGRFFERLNRLPARPCSIVMQEGCIPAATPAGDKETWSKRENRQDKNESRGDCGVQRLRGTRTDSLPGARFQGVPA